MGEKFKNKYRIASTRLQNWDYGWNGAYFVTICTKNKECYFGEIVDKQMELSKIGVIANIMWYEIKNHAKNIELGEFVVMPNHIHGILILHDDNTDDIENVANVETRHALSLRPHHQSPNQPESEKTIGQKRFQNQGNNTLSSIVGGYKSAVTKHARRLSYEFHWQARFYDHIIRNDESFNTISNYIANNPQTWETDKFRD